MGDGLQFVGTDWSGAVLREVVLSRARLLGVLLDGAEIDGDIRGLVVNGVEVEPLVSAELDRRHPERVLLRAGDPAGMRAAWAAVEEFWAATVRRALTLPEEALHRQVDGEWSFVQTLQHLVFVTDGWLSHAVLGQPRPYHPIGLVATFMSDAASLGIDPSAAPSLAEVLAVRAGRLAAVRSYLAGVTQDELDRRREQPAGGYPPPAARTAAQCLHVIFNEEWEHHRFAVRDLAVVEAG